MTTEAERGLRVGWERAWDERLEEIDELIVSSVRRNGGISAGRLRRLSDEVRLWFDQQVPHLSYDPDWQRAKSEPDTLQELLAERFRHLLSEDRLCLSVVEKPLVGE